jgi:hypothetical protein
VLQAYTRREHCVCLPCFAHILPIFTPYPRPLAGQAQGGDQGIGQARPASVFPTILLLPGLCNHPLRRRIEEVGVAYLEDEGERLACLHVGGSREAGDE